MSHYRRGRSFEYTVKKWLEDEGFSVIRSAGSHGEFDLIAYRPSTTNSKEIEVLFIQCKAGEGEQRVLETTKGTFRAIWLSKKSRKKSWSEFLSEVLES